MLPLTWNADYESLPNNQRRVEFSVRWRNWLNGNRWTAIDLTPRQVSGEWVFDRSPYALTVPPLADGWLTLESTNEYDIWTKAVRRDAKVGIQKRYHTAISVPGIPSNGGILFAGAFPSLNAGRLVLPKRDTVQDLVVFAIEPPGRGPVEIPFTVDFGSLPILESQGNRQSPKEADFRSDKTVTKGLSFTTGTFRGIKIKQPFAWDSAGKRAAIEIVGRVVGTQFIGKKVIPRAFFVGATYPVFADTTSTFYPDPNTETTSVDGYVSREGVAESWATIRAGAGNAASDTVASEYAYMLWVHAISTNWSYMRRSIYLFDTSAIGDTDTIDSATFSFYGAAAGFNDVLSDSISLVGSTPASNTAIVSADYAQLGTTLFAPALDLGSYNQSGYNAFALNATGLAAISKTGITKLGLRGEADRANSEPSHSANQRSSVYGYYADNAGTTNDPKLSVTYTAPTVVFSVANNASDAFYREDQASLTQDIYHPIGRFVGTPLYYNGIYRLTGTEIPAGSIIDSVVFQLKTNDETPGTVTNTWKATIRAIKTLNASMPANVAAAESATRTTASVEWNKSGAWSADTVYAAPDITAVVQEVVDLGATTAIVLLVEDASTENVTNTGNFQAKDGSYTVAAGITYHEGSAPPSVPASCVAVQLTTMFK